MQQTAKRLQPPKRPPTAGSFGKGNKANPSGRPKKTEEERTLEEMCRAKTPEALATILTIMAGGENERNRLASAQYIIDRGWGRAAQAMEITGKDGGALDIRVIERVIVDVRA